MKEYVIDASVACRFLLVEDLSDKAERVLRGFLMGELDLVAPELVTYEVGNSLWKAVGQGILDQAEAKKVFSYFLGLGLTSNDELEEDQHIEALVLGVRLRATYYDSAYVALSKHTGATLLTADDTFYEKAQGEIPTIHLKDFP